MLRNHVVSTFTSVGSVVNSAAFAGLITISTVVLIATAYLSAVGQFVVA